MRSGLRFLICAALAALTSPTHAAGFRDFKGWHVGCDNTGMCRAMGFALDHGLPSNTFTIIDREAGPSGKIRWIKSGALAVDSTVFIDGKKIVDLPATSFEDGNDKIPQGLMDQDRVTKMIASALDGAFLTFDEKAKDSERISLQGFKAAMLFIDEQQGRVGTTTAIVAKGDKPAASVPSARPLPLLPLKDIPKAGSPDESIEKAIIDFHRQQAKRHDCSNLPAEEPSVLSSAPLERKGWLLEVDCWRAAYQAGTVLYLFTYENRYAAAEFAPIETLDTKMGRVSISRGRSLANLDFDTAAQLNAFGKGRGMGDCGTSESWRWDGKVYRLADYKILIACGVGASEEDWITLWRTRER